MPIVPKQTATAACASYALETLLPLLGLSGLEMEELRWHDFNDHAKVALTHLIMPDNSKMGLALIMLRRDPNKDLDFRWFPCIVRLKQSNKIVQHYRLYFRPDDINNYDTIPEIIGYKRLIAWQHSRKAILDANQSRKTTRRIRPLPLRAIPPLI